MIDEQINERLQAEFSRIVNVRGLLRAVCWYWVRARRTRSPFSEHEKFRVMSMLCINENPVISPMEGSPGIKETAAIIDNACESQSRKGRADEALRCFHYQFPWVDEKEIMEELETVVDIMNASSGNGELPFTSDFDDLIEEDEGLILKKIRDKKTADIKGSIGNFESDKAIQKTLSKNNIDYTVSEGNTISFEVFDMDDTFLTTVIGSDDRHTYIAMNDIRTSRMPKDQEAQSMIKRALSGIERELAPGIDTRFILTAGHEIWLVSSIERGGDLMGAIVATFNEVIRVVSSICILIGTFRKDEQK